MKELEISSKSMPPVSFDPSKVFDVTKHIRLVPPFQEKEVDKYFLHFEKVAENFKWPKEHWTLLLQSVVIGKAREIYTQLPLDQSSDHLTNMKIRKLEMMHSLKKSHVPDGIRTRTAGVAKSNALTTEPKSRLPDAVCQRLYLYDTLYRIAVLFIEATHH